MCIRDSGNISKLEYLKNKVNEEGEPANEFYIPVTSNDEVNAAFRDLGFVPEGLMWLYENMDTDAYETFRSDWYKDVPGWGDVSGNMSQQAVKCENGEVQPEAVAKEAETLCNEILALSLIHIWFRSSTMVGRYSSMFQVRFLSFWPPVIILMAMPASLISPSVRFRRSR